MYKKVIFATSLMVMCQVSAAETCPTVKDIKSNQIHGWTVRDSDDNTRVSAEREAAFIKNIEQFVLAEWKQGKNNSSMIHCYYRDISGGGLEANLTKENYSPIHPGHNWYQVSGSQECAAGMAKCEFGQNPLVKSHLATTDTPKTAL